MPKQKHSIVPPRPPPEREWQFGEGDVPRAAVVYLALDGAHVIKGGWSADNAQQNTSPIVQGETAEVPAFDHAPWGDDRATVIADRCALA